MQTASTVSQILIYEYSARASELSFNDLLTDESSPWVLAVRHEEIIGQNSKYSSNRHLMGMRTVSGSGYFTFVLI